MGDLGAPDEIITIPVAVARRLKVKQASGEVPVSSRAELLYVIRQESASCCSFKAESLLNRRDYSYSDLTAKLRADGYGERLVEEVVARLSRAGVVDDSRYAGAYIRAKLSAGWGTRKIEFELRKRGIEAAEVPGWPYEFVSADDEFDRALSLAQRKHFTSGDVYGKCVRFLCGRGFGADVASRVARRIKEDVGDLGHVYRSGVATSGF